MNTENKAYDTRVVPFVRYERVIKNGRKQEIVLDNLTAQECKNMSCLPKMLRENSEGVYIVDTPLTFNGFTGVRGFLCYVFDELTEEEQDKYFSRSVVIPTTIENVQKKQTSKELLGRRKIKERK